MKREFLKELGLEKEMIDKIMDENGKDIEAQKTAAETAKTEAEGLKTQLSEANKQIESFKGLDVEGIKKAADEWKTKFEETDAKAKKDMDDLKFNHALDGEISSVKAKNAKTVRALLDMNGLKLIEDGSIVGLKEQLEKIKQENDYLFEGETKVPTVVKGASGNLPAGSDAAIRAVMGLPAAEK